MKSGRPGRTVAQRLVEVPAAREDVLDLRPAHEGRVVAVPRADLFHRVAEQDHRIGRFQPRARLERDLDLARPELDLQRAQRQAERRQIAPQHREDGVELVKPDLGQVLVAVG